MLLSRLGVPFTVHGYEHDPAAGSYGREAADRLAPVLGITAQRVLKTLVARVDARLVVAVLPVTDTLDLKALAVAGAGKRARLADRDDAERVTGYVAGGISPLGQRRGLPTYVEQTTLRHPTVLVSGGRRGLDLELSPDDLVRGTGAVAVRLSRR